mmetsp:Transcript_6038/g.10032  ORF Transcript_6038/g.10032 Transcript_6038/m.10032 type:complete len:101 (-) Transcript_6038:138-440(-)
MSPKMKRESMTSTNRMERRSIRMKIYCLRMNSFLMMKNSGQMRWNHVFIVHRVYHWHHNEVVGTSGMYNSFGINLSLSPFYFIQKGGNGNHSLLHQLRHT